MDILFWQLTYPLSQTLVAVVLSYHAKQGYVNCSQKIDMLGSSWAIFVWKYMYVGMQVWMYTCMYVCALVCTCMYVCMYVCKNGQIMLKTGFKLCTKKNPTSLSSFWRSQDAFLIAKSKTTNCSLLIGPINFSSHPTPPTTSRNPNRRPTPS